MRMPILKRLMLLAPTFIGVLWAVLAGAQTSHSAEKSFLAENRTAMEKMMAGMSVKATGDVDQDFAAMMIPHHQGAIEMAKSELRYGSNAQLRRIAQEIIVEQQQEIVAMRGAAHQPVPPSTASSADAAHRR